MVEDKGIFNHNGLTQSANSSPMGDIPMFYCLLPITSNKEVLLPYCGKKKIEH